MYSLVSGRIIQFVFMFVSSFEHNIPLLNKSSTYMYIPWPTMYICTKNKRAYTNRFDIQNLTRMLFKFERFFSSFKACFVKMLIHVYWKMPTLQVLKKLLHTHIYRRSLFTIFRKPIPAHVNIQVQFYTKHNITRGIQTKYIYSKCINI